MCSNERRAEIATISWSLWKARNELAWNNRYTQISVVIALAKQYFVQWKFAQKNDTTTYFPVLEEGDGAVVWVKPQKNQIKISVDAARFEEYQATGIGMVARNDQGELLQARTMRMNYLF
ncbi:uncharacterized protein LOC141701477 [Apium graveolens]|uniref:uncharacterized protein LOC141701477 n=1 Tax=Apium graveolens TaxID=4045 RepID=UPI003D79B235